MGKIQKSNKLVSRHRLILYRHLAGQSNKDIAEELGHSPEHISRVVNSDLFKAEKERLLKKAEDTVVDRIANASELSIELLEDVLVQDGVPLSERIKVAQDILDRAGYSPKREVKVQHSLVDLIERAYEKRTKQIDVSSQELIEAEAEEDTS